MKRTLCALTFLSCVSLTRADDWPGWRGPTGQGTSAEKDLPLKWDRTTNVRWKVALPAPGNSTPIVWGDRVFLTQASDLKQWPPKVPANYAGGASPGGRAIAEKRSVLCFRRSDGKLLWQGDTIYKEPEMTHPTNPFCSASPVTDGERVIASHGSAGVVCYDFEGKRLWHHDVGKLKHLWGNASSPILYGDLCIQWCGPGERQFLRAVNKHTGKKVWETAEAGGDTGITSRKFLGSWCTPIIARVAPSPQPLSPRGRGEQSGPLSPRGRGGEKRGQEQLIFAVPFKLAGYDPKTGKELWSAKVPGTYCYSSPLYVEGLAIYGSSLTKLGGSGDITKDQLRYRVGSMYIGTAVIAGEYLYTVNNVGVPSCYEWKTGQELWKDQIEKRPGVGDSWGSLVHVGGRIYLTDQRGDTVVLAAGRKYEHLATNRLDEHTNASIAVSGGDLFIRTHKHLWCIGQKKEPKEK